MAQALGRFFEIFMWCALITFVVLGMGAFFFSVSGFSLLGEVTCSYMGWSVTRSACFTTSFIVHVIAVMGYEPYCKRIRASRRAARRNLRIKRDFR